MAVDIHISTEDRLFTISLDNRCYKIEEFEVLGRSLNFIESYPYYGSLTECIFYICQTFIWGQSLLIDEIWDGTSREYST